MPNLHQIALSFSTAVERNNLMRLSQSIPFTPVPPRGMNFHLFISIFFLDDLSSGQNRPGRHNDLDNIAFKTQENE